MNDPVPHQDESEGTPVPASVPPTEANSTAVEPPIGRLSVPQAHSSSTSLGFAWRHSITANEATVHDLKLAEALGYVRPADIRKLIKRHIIMLEAMGLVRHRGVPIVSGKGRLTTVTEYHLTKAQAAYVTAKSSTAQAHSLTILMAEVFALTSDNRLAAVDEVSAKELAQAHARESRRRFEEEREARSQAFGYLK